MCPENERRSCSLPLSRQLISHRRQGTDLPVRRMFKTKGNRRMAEYYCVKCKTKREMKDAERVTMKNGKPALKGKCAVCGTTINSILPAAAPQKA